MKRVRLALLGALAALMVAQPAAAGVNWPAKQGGPLADAPGYVPIPNAAVPRDPTHAYKALFNAETGPKDRTKPLGQLMRVGAQVNGLRLANVPTSNIRFAMIFHGPAVDALLTDKAYRAKSGVNNPNLPLLAELKRAGVHFYVCGQYMAGVDLPRADLIADAEVAESATLVMIRLENDGYALIGE